MSLQSNLSFSEQTYLFDFNKQIRRRVWADQDGVRSHAKDWGRGLHCLLCSVKSKLISSFFTFSTPQDIKEKTEELRKEVESIKEEIAEVRQHQFTQFVFNRVDFFMTTGRTKRWKASRSQEIERNENRIVTRGNSKCWDYIINYNAIHYKDLLIQFCDY